jgi:hypothetical protein
MQDFRRDGGVDAHTAEGDAPRPGSVVDVSIVPDIASNATKPVALNPICVRSARTGAARREARRRGAPSPVEPSAARQPTGVAAGVPSFFLRDGERGKRAARYPDECDIPERATSHRRLAFTRLLKS